MLRELAREGVAAVLPTATLKVRNHDCTFRFRPDSDFWYLTGFAEPGATLVLLPGLPDAEDEAHRSPRTILFLRERDPLQETWNGRRLGTEAAPAALGVDEARNVDELWETLPNLLAGYGRVLYRTGIDEERDRSMLKVIDRLRQRSRTGTPPLAELVDPTTVVHELRLFKNEAELECMRRAASVTEEAHLAAMASAAPGVGEQEIDALIEQLQPAHLQRVDEDGEIRWRVVGAGDSRSVERPLGRFLGDALVHLDEHDPDFPVRMLSLLESVLDNPEAIL